jgi:uncharacterized protein (DUF2236 family)
VLHMQDGASLARASVARRVNRELFLLLGGPAALLLQVAQPLVAKGVDEHSDFQRDPVGRLHRTLDTTLALVFGTEADVEGALRRIDERHATVRGLASDGRAYSARDPALLLWVQCTLVLTSLRLYELVLGPLPQRDRDAYWEESKPFGIALGIPADLLPARVTDLERYERDALRNHVRPDATSRRIGRAVLRPFPWLPAPLHWPIDSLTAALLPRELRAPFGLRFRTRERLLFRAVIVTLRVLRAALPAGLTTVPQARRWDARQAASSRARVA